MGVVAEERACFGLDAFAIAPAGFVSRSMCNLAFDAGGCVTEVTAGGTRRPLVYAYLLKAVLG